MLRITHQALEKFDNQHDFERMCADILNALGNHNVVLVAPRGGGDGAQDVTYVNYDKEPALACVSLRKDANTKIMSDLSSRKKGDFAEYTFFTNQYLSSAEKKKIAKYCLDELDAQFIPRDIEYIRSLLDTSLKSIRLDYLHIEDENLPVYSAGLVEVERYSVQQRLALAELNLQSYVAEEEREKANSYGLIRPVGMSLYSKSASEMVILQRNYLRALKKRSVKLPSIVGFNIELSSSVADEHIEVITSVDASARLVFDVDILPDAPNKDGLDIANIRPARMHHDNAEFYATPIESTGAIKSNLERINGRHDKVIFDEPVFVVMPEEVDQVDVSLKIFSKLLSGAQDIKLTVSKGDAIEKEL